MKPAISAVLPGLALCVAALGAPPAIPGTPAAIREVVLVREFTTDKAFSNSWRKDATDVSRGVLLVLRVDAALVYPRQVAEPVLYVGDQTARRVNVGYESGYVVAIVPGEVDLTKAPIWFGSPELPERVDAEMIRKERESARRAGIKPLDEKSADSARERGGPRVRVADEEALLREAATLIERYSPTETDLVAGLRVEKDRHEK